MPFPALSGLDWFTGLSVSFVIGYSDNFDFGFVCVFPRLAALIGSRDCLYPLLLATVITLILVLRHLIKNCSAVTIT